MCQRATSPSRRFWRGLDSGPRPTSEVGVVLLQRGPPPPRHQRLGAIFFKKKCFFERKSGLEKAPGKRARFLLPLPQAGLFLSPDSGLENEPANLRSWPFFFQPVVGKKTRNSEHLFPGRLPPPRCHSAGKRHAHAWLSVAFWICAFTMHKHAAIFLSE